jgi:hypothetical protein
VAGRFVAGRFVGGRFVGVPINGLHFRDSVVDSEMGPLSSGAIIAVTVQQDATGV